ncbi:Probable GMP synthase [glutamine-hydrolyzing] [Linum perenne]
MCSSKVKQQTSTPKTPPQVPNINGRPVLQPKSNQLSPKKTLTNTNSNPSSPPTKTLRKAASFTLDRRTTFASSLIVEAPGTIAAARREHVAIIQEQRKQRTAHYGRTKSCKFFSSSVVVPEEQGSLEPKRCSFITPNSDPIYVAYHDEEWGVPVHDDMLLLELLVLTGAQVKKEFGSFDKYLWKFMNNKPMSSQYRSSHKMPVKSSKSETISKDMVKRGFRLVGPTVIHSFMQAAGLINDHLVTCPRHIQCQLLASSSD